jgi:Protein of unknown function (DUF1501)
MTRSSFSPFGLLSRRDWLKLSTAGVLGASVSGWLGNLAATAATDLKRQRSCILLWMAGGPSQIETFDPKPGHKNGGPTKAIATSVPGIQISEHLPQIAKHADQLALFRSISSNVDDHGQGAILMSTGYKDGGPVNYPSIGAAMSKELAGTQSPLPSYVSIRSPLDNGGLPPRAYGPGFLGPRHVPLSLVPIADALGQAGDNLDAYNKLFSLPDAKLASAMPEPAARARMDLLRELDREFVTGHPGTPGQSHQSAYDRAARLLLSPAAKAFSLEEEPARLRDTYGRNFFGQGCLLARRLVERGVAFVEVTLGAAPGQPANWDMHGNIFNAIPPLCGVLDKGWAALMGDLKDRGLLDSTLIVWMGEFGRTPNINGGRGRDHFSRAWSTVLGGGGIKGGQVIGKTSADGMKIDDRPVTVQEFLATAYAALGIDPHKQNNTPAGRPIRLVNAEVQPVKEALR